MHEQLVLLVEAHKSKEQFFDVLEKTFPRASEEHALIRRAYAETETTLAGRYRKDGSPAMSHPHAVALLTLYVLIHLRTVRRETIDNATIAQAIVAALLHDNVEDVPGEWTVKRIRQSYGTNVAEIVDVLSKLPVEAFAGDKKKRDAAYFARLWVGHMITKLLKLCDRFHFHMTVDGLTSESIERKRKETEEVLLPIAYNLNVLADELEWICRLTPEGLLKEPVL